MIFSLSGFYADANGKCKECPDGVDCGKRGSALAALIIKDGWYRFSSASTSVYQCTTNDCLGGNTTTGVCREGSKGYLCGRCEKDWYLRTATNSCAKCATINTGAIVVPPLLFFLLVAVVLTVAYRTRQRVQEWMKDSSEW